uniref:PiggyBac transposable element-derived protein domain-containing protein n=1 Tax=Timema monikensis TaxID=170555 RepID=A0A7R9EEN1_9NEOP|nr:unnamed protein product [Timema monikensis]
MLDIEVVVMNVSDPLLYQGYATHTDNCYSSPTLFRLLLDNETYALGTVREVVNQRSKNIRCHKWQYKKDVLMLSTMHHSPLTTDIGKMTSVKQKTYNKAMGDVDCQDQVLSSFPVMRRYVEKNLFVYMFDMALYNSFVVWKILTGKRESYAEFRLNFVEQILEHYPSRGKPSLGPSPLRIQTKHWAHFVMKIPPTKRCFVCAPPKEVRSETVWQCEKCEIPLHIPTCFRDYHIKTNF